MIKTASCLVLAALVLAVPASAATRLVYLPQAGARALVYGGGQQTALELANGARLGRLAFEAAEGTFRAAAPAADQLLAYVASGGDFYVYHAGSAVKLASYAPASYKTAGDTLAYVT